MSCKYVKGYFSLEPMIESTQRMLGAKVSGDSLTATIKIIIRTECDLVNDKKALNIGFDRNEPE